MTSLPLFPSLHRSLPPFSPLSFIASHCLSFHQYFYTHSSIDRNGQSGSLFPLLSFRYVSFQVLNIHNFFYPLVLCDLDIDPNIRDIYANHIDANVSSLVYLKTFCIVLLAINPSSEIPVISPLCSQFRLLRLTK